MDESPIHGRIFHYALLCSVAFHVLLFLIFADFLQLTVTNQSQVVTPTIAAQLHRIAPVAPVVSDARVSSTQEPPPKVTKRAEPGPETILSVQSDKPPSLSTSGSNAPAPLASDNSDNSGASPTKVEVPSLEAPDANDLRTYRLNLSREARRFKRYPAIARERGLEGVVVVVVSTRAGVALPQVSLSQGSGEPVLDRQALEMVSLAVRYATMPDSLRQRDFGLDLPIHFSLDE